MSIKTLSELIAELQEIQDALGDAEVRIAYQPQYPLSAPIANVTYVERDEEQTVVWLATGAQDANAPYAPHEAWDKR